jgi:hypothetical protein
MQFDYNEIAGQARNDNRSFNTFETASPGLRNPQATLRSPAVMKI